jgi:hypothetical protein
VETLEPAGGETALNWNHAQVSRPFGFTIEFNVAAAWLVLQVWLLTGRIEAEAKLQRALTVNVAAELVVEPCGVWTSTR